MYYNYANGRMQELSQVDVLLILAWVCARNHSIGPLYVLAYRNSGVLFTSSWCRGSFIACTLEPAVLREVHLVSAKLTSVQSTMKRHHEEEAAQGVKTTQRPMVQKKGRVTAISHVLNSKHGSKVFFLELFTDAQDVVHVASSLESQAVWLTQINIDSSYCFTHLQPRQIVFKVSVSTPLRELMRNWALCGGHTIQGVALTIDWTADDGVISFPDTQHPLSAVPDTQHPLSAVPDTQHPLSAVPDTQHPLSAVPDTQQPLSAVPNTQHPLSAVPDTQHPLSAVPDTQHPLSAVSDTQHPANCQVFFHRTEASSWFGKPVKYLSALKLKKATLSKSMIVTISFPMSNPTLKCRQGYVTDVFRPLAMFQLDNKLNFCTALMMKVSDVPQLCVGQRVIVYNVHCVSRDLMMCARSRVSIVPHPEQSVPAGAPGREAEKYLPLIDLSNELRLSFRDILWLKKQFHILEEKFDEKFLFSLTIPRRVTLLPLDTGGGN
ncbi:unnamed protein product [Timema podura]|uniref:Uncharacterized protein n=1 Tax=Timema podura TaxID=61482 RepID=A0ABN7ND51_TIMPD|nr:unnamed protein product [Timema podura]